MAETRQHVLDVATKAFEHFKDGLATGRWQPFLDMVTDDFTLWFPLGKFRGLNQGRERAEEFFRFVRETFPDGLEVTLDRVTSNDTTVVFEFRDHGTMRGNPYHNRVAVSFDVRGTRISEYREYFGLVGS